MTQLVKYEAARRALIEAHRVDEAKDIRDKADAMQRYAMQAKDSQLIELATDIKLRAERRAGELLRAMPKNKGSKDQLRGRNSSGGSKTESPEDKTPKLSDLGISGKESMHWQKLAAMPEDKFEEKVTTVKSAMRAKTEGPKQRQSRGSGGGGGRKGTVQPRNKTVEEKDRPALARQVLNDGRPISAVANDAGVSVQIVKTAIEREKGRREAEPTITPDMLSMSAQQKLDSAIRQHKAKLEAGFHKAVNDGVRAFLEETILPIHRKEQEEAKRVMNARRGITDKPTYNLIWSCLHPDSRLSASDKKLATAFNAFEALEKRMLTEKDSPTDFQSLPRTMAEWDKQRATRRAKRTNSTNTMSRR